jgi:hypothetical protein
VSRADGDELTAVRAARVNDAKLPYFRLRRLQTTILEHFDITISSETGSRRGALIASV